MNKLTKIFNNIGCYCSASSEGFLLSSSINGYQSLDNSSIGYYIPYIVRNLKDNYKWEIGVGEVQYRDADIFVKRIEIASSSNKNNAENFSGNNNEFYLFVNNINFNSNFNNVILKNDHFQIDNVSSIYLIDNTEKSIDCSLPDPTKARNIVIDIKALSSDHNIKIRTHEDTLFDSTNDSIRLVSDGQTWYALNKLDNAVNLALSSSTSNFSAQSDPTGPDYSFVYKDGSNLVGSEVYWSPNDTNKILLGSSSENTAHSIIPTSGDGDVVFNKDLRVADFKVYGSGSPQRNFWFSYDGRVGVNIPVGSKPQTVFHVVNYSCREILRLENLAGCEPAKLTIVHNPINKPITNNSKVSILNLAGMNSAGVSREYANISSVATDATRGEGGLVLSVLSSGNQQNIVSGDATSITVGYDNNRALRINNNGNVSLSGNAINVQSSSSSSLRTNSSSIVLNNNQITLSHSSLDLGNGNISATGTTTFNDLRIANIPPNSLLTVNSQRRLVPVSGLNIDSVNSRLVLNNIPSNKLLSVDENKNIVGLYDLGDYFLTENDIVWNKYSPRQATICLKQAVFTSPVSADEFGINDQVEIRSGDTLTYRQVKEIIYNDNNIVELTLDQSVTTSTTNADILSITKGGVLVMQKFSDGVPSDSTSNILSIRPFTETVFNSGKKDINFTIYGTDTKPAFKVHANVGSINRSSGVYYNFATRNNHIVPIVVNNSGLGLSSSFSSANYDYNSTRNQFEARVSSVGSNGVSSYYGTYDQQGNVSEWLESSRLNGFISREYTAGGSYKTSGTLIIENEDGSLEEIDNRLALRGINGFIAISGYEDVGFRVASLTNIPDNDNISNANKLNLTFVNITNANNIADQKQLKIDGEVTTRDNLGVVDKNYRIGRYEITNNQYVQFLNSVATGLSSLTNDLYDPRMSGLLGGINKQETIANGTATYSVKPNMSDKPVNFVSYINSLRFINWLENGAPSGINSRDIDEIINQGSYDILASSNSVEVNTNPNRKYFLPSLDQWHKAAYFEYQESVVISGSPVITINTDSPNIVATERITTLDALSTEQSQDPRKLLANLTVSGWLVVDKIIVRNHNGPGRALRSTLADIGFTPDTTSGGSSDSSSGGGSQGSFDPGAQSTTNQNQPPLPDSNDGFQSDRFWNDTTSVSLGGSVYAEIRPPLPVNIAEESIDIDCADAELIENNNLPFWCKPLGKFIGPSFY